MPNFASAFQQTIVGIDDHLSLNLMSDCVHEHSYIDGNTLRINNPERAIAFTPDPTINGYSYAGASFYKANRGGNYFGFVSENAQQFGSVSPVAGASKYTPDSISPAYTGNVPLPGVGTRAIANWQTDEDTVFNIAFATHGSLNGLRREYVNTPQHDTTIGSPNSSTPVFSGFVTTSFAHYTLNLDLVGQNDLKLYQASEFDGLTRYDYVGSSEEKFYPIDLYMYNFPTIGVQATNVGTRILLIAHDLVAYQVFDETQTYSSTYNTEKRHGYIAIGGGETEFDHYDSFQVVVDSGTLPASIGTIRVNNSGATSFPDNILALSLSSDASTNVRSRGDLTGTQTVPPGTSSYTPLTQAPFQVSGTNINGGAPPQSITDNGGFRYALVRGNVFTPQPSSSVFTPNRTYVSDQFFSGLIGREIAWVERTATGYERFRGTITGYEVTAGGQVPAVTTALTSTTLQLTRTLSYVDVSLTSSETVQWDYHANQRAIAVGQGLIYTTDGYGDLPIQSANNTFALLAGVPTLLTPQVDLTPQSTELFTERWQVIGSKAQLVGTESRSFFDADGQFSGQTPNFANVQTWF